MPKDYETRLSRKECTHSVTTVDRSKNVSVTPEDTPTGISSGTMPVWLNVWVT